MIEYYKNGFRNMTDFRSRATRPEFWYFYLMNFIVIISLYILFFILIFASEEMALLPLIGLFGYALVAAIAQLSLSVRRLHDTGKSGWFHLIGVIPLIGAILLIVFWAQPTELKTNKWGPVPGVDPLESDFADSLIKD